MPAVARLALFAALAAVSACMETAAVDEAAAPLAPTAADRETPAYRACLQAIATTTTRPASDVQIYEYLFSEANTQIMATVAGAEAPWRCLSSTDGIVAEVLYTGSEGAL